MINIAKVLLTSVVFVLFNSCERDDATSEIHSDFVVTFQIEKLNSTSNYATFVKSANFKNINQWWSPWADNKTMTLTREVTFDLELENGETVEFGFWFLKYESKDLLKLTEGQVLLDGTVQYEKQWDYLLFIEEANNFYRGFDEARILINNTVIFTKHINEDFEILKVEPVLVNGEEKSQLTIKFKGETQGWYSGKDSDYFRISNGIFKGVIE